MKGGTRRRVVRVIIQAVALLLPLEEGVLPAGVRAERLPPVERMEQRNAIISDQTGDTTPEVQLVASVVSSQVGQPVVTTTSANAWWPDSSSYLTIGIIAAGISLALLLLFLRRGRPAQKGNTLRLHKRTVQSVRPVPDTGLTLLKTTPDEWASSFIAPDSLGVAQKPVLRALDGHFRGSVVELTDEPLTIGRDPRNCQLVFPFTMTEIGRTHCMLRFDKATQAFLLEDCDSATGTFLRAGQRLGVGSPKQLRPGQRFYLSNPRTMFEVDFERN